MINASKLTSVLHLLGGGRRVRLDASKGLVRSHRLTSKGVVRLPAEVRDRLAADSSLVNAGRLPGDDGNHPRDYRLPFAARNRGAGGVGTVRTAENRTEPLHLYRLGRHQHAGGPTRSARAIGKTARLTILTSTICATMLLTTGTALATEGYGLTGSFGSPSSASAAIQRCSADLTARMIAAIAAHALTTPSAPASRDADRAACVCNWPTASRRRPSASLGVIPCVDIRPTVRPARDETLRCGANFCVSGDKSQSCRTFACSVLHLAAGAPPLTTPTVGSCSHQLTRAPSAHNTHQSRGGGVVAVVCSPEASGRR